jgi:hypothetical protein
MTFNEWANEYIQIVKTLKTITYWPALYNGEWEVRKETEFQEDKLIPHDDEEPYEIPQEDSTQYSCNLCGSYFDIEDIFLHWKAHHEI